MENTDCAERIRLANILGMLGSDQDGEVVNAGRMADKIVRGSGTTWSNILEPQVVTILQEPKREATELVKMARDTVHAYQKELATYELDFLLDAIFRGGNSRKTIERIAEISEAVERARKSSVNKFAYRVNEALLKIRTLSEKEATFLATMRVTKREPSGKQAKWLNDLAAMAGVSK